MAEMLRYNQGKPQLSFLPQVFVRAVYTQTALRDADALLSGVAEVLTFGAVKYSRNNWRTGGSWCRVADSALRHALFGIAIGEVLDPESKLPHLAHIGCNVAFLLEFQAYGLGEDDRYRRTNHVAWPDEARVAVTEGEANAMLLADTLYAFLEGDNDALVEMIIPLVDQMKALSND